MKYTGLNLPAHCTMIEEHELHEIHGGGDTSHSGGYGGWDASFNLGSFFGALLRLFS